MLREGDTMEVYGSGLLNLGYMGGVYDAGTGLIYMGNGQYYDPSTGRFLTRGAQQDQSNPYTPWNSDPAGMLIAPLALLALVFGRKKTRTKFDQFVILFVIVLSVGLSVSACDTKVDITITPTEIMNPTEAAASTATKGWYITAQFRIDGTETQVAIYATTEAAPANTPTPTECIPMSTETPTPTSTQTPTNNKPAPTTFGSLSTVVHPVTGVSALEIYNHYIILWDKPDTEWWWEMLGKDEQGNYDEDGFSFWDYVSIYMGNEALYYEVDMIENMSEAGIRFWYERVKYGTDQVGNEGFLNWWASFCQSNATDVKATDTPLKRLRTREILEEFRSMANRFRDADTYKSDWTKGWNYYQPYNWGNLNSIEIHSENSQVGEMLMSNATKKNVIFEYIPGGQGGYPFFVPSGCAQVNWIDNTDDNPQTAHNPDVCNALIIGQ